MKNSYSRVRMLACACMAAPGLVLAQAMPVGSALQMARPTAALSSAVTDPSAAVPPVIYQSVFAGTSTGVEMESADWKKANADVGQFKRGHVDILKWDEAQTKAPMLTKPMPTDAPKPTISPAPAAPSTPLPPSAPAPQMPGMHKH